MRIAVLGVGAVGSWLAAGLARSGQEVSLLARGGTLAALREHGLVFREGERIERFRLPATDDPARLDADILVIALKGHDLTRALPTIAAALRPQTRVVPVLNGLPWWFFQGFGGPAEGLVLESVDPGGALGRAVPVARVLGGVAHVAARVEAPGEVRLVKADRLLLGDPAGGGLEALDALVAAFRAGGVPAQAVADIRMEAWLKLWGNAPMNPISALTRADLKQMMDDDAVRAVVEGMMQEMAALGARIGLPIADSIADRIAVARRLGAFRTSMLQDLEAGRPLELGPILGGLVELAEHLGAPAPLLRGVHGMTRLLANNLGLGR